MYELVAFYLFAALTIGMFCVTVFSKNALYSMSALAGGMIFISGFFFLLDAEFLGVVQIIVYSGAIMALYAFGMMFFDSTDEVKEDFVAKKTVYTLAILSAVLIVIILAAPLWGAHLENAVLVTENLGNVQSLGLAMFTNYLIAFELSAVMLLVAMISGIVLVSKQLDNSITLADEVDTQESL
ncbi:MAG: NADH-quinone oxidoreductase subunit J [Sulfurospirillaceae bacterium]|jgi:NADH-quinone oxidoreductase subunit J|nr:NADH-quinone oxidoreductase subunit J [Sulfurospirillaceae bacterium]MCK9545184.1 NADH-quinone oxidoreductase subunit J [Sulfurospirillaceae bacterium]MDY0238501.1 NADH-quinone oxidoreductase subunit J [Campylobacterales bacterium]NLM99322.1 NADH-quinone oxidoreductase subunit J [Campylobacteraceae bacterium]